MKKCKTCNEDKDLDEFHKDKARKDGLKGSCKMCAGSKAKNWRRNNRTRDSRSAIARKKKYRDRNQSFIANYLKENPCVSCGEANIVVLEFDHLRDKKHNLCSMVSGVPTGYSLHTIKEEVAKCQILCSNCHKKKTAKDQNWWILKH